MLRIHVNLCTQVYISVRQVCTSMNMQDLSDLCSGDELISDLCSGAELISPHGDIWPRFVQHRKKDQRDPSYLLEVHTWWTEVWVRKCPICGTLSVSTFFIHYYISLFSVIIFIPVQCRCYCWASFFVHIVVICFPEEGLHEESEMMDIKFFKTISVCTAGPQNQEAWSFFL